MHTFERLIMFSLTALAKPLALVVLLLPSMAAAESTPEASLPLASNQIASPQPMPLEQVGRTQMRWLWFNLYEAKLYTQTGSYELNQWPLSLELIYQRSIKAKYLIEGTKREWSRQNIEYNPKWLDELANLWPDVALDDKIILYVDDQANSHFYFNDEFLGSLEDPLFAPAFTAIWLSENTIKPQQRNQLIGL